MKFGDLKGSKWGVKLTTFLKFVRGLAFLLILGNYKFMCE